MSGHTLRTLAEEVGIKIEGKSKSELEKILRGLYLGMGDQIASRNAQLRELRGKLTFAQAEYETLQKQFEKEHAVVEDERGKVVQRYDELEQAAEKLLEQQNLISGLDVQLDAARNTIQSLNREIEHAQDKRSEHKKVLKDVQAEREKELDYLLGKAKEAGVAVKPTMGVKELAEVLSARLAEYTNTEREVRAVFAATGYSDTETASITDLTKKCAVQLLAARGELGKLHADWENQVEDLYDKIKRLQSKEGEGERCSELGKKLEALGGYVLALYHLIDDTTFAFDAEDILKDPTPAFAHLHRYVSEQKKGLLEKEAAITMLKKENAELNDSYAREQKRARLWMHSTVAGFTGFVAAAASAVYLYFMPVPPPPPPPPPPDYTLDIQELCADFDGIVGKFIAPDACAGNYGSGKEVFEGIRRKVENAQQSTYQGLFLTNVLKNVLGEVKKEENRPVRFVVETPASRLYLFSADNVVETKLTPLPSNGWYEVTIPKGYGAQKDKLLDVRAFLGAELFQHDQPLHLIVNGKLETIQRAENDATGALLFFAAPGSDLWQFLQDGNTIRYVPQGIVIPDGIKDFQFIREIRIADSQFIGDIGVTELQRVGGTNAIRLNARAVGKRLEDIFDAACVTLHVTDASYSHANSDGATACRANTNAGKVPYQWSVELFNMYPPLTGEFVEKTYLHTGFLQQEPHTEPNHPLNTYNELIEKLDAAHRDAYAKGICRKELLDGLTMNARVRNAGGTYAVLRHAGVLFACPELGEELEKIVTQWAAEWVGAYPLIAAFDRHFEIALANKHGQCYEPIRTSNIEVFIPTDTVGSFEGSHRYHIEYNWVTHTEQQDVDWGRPRTCAPPTIYLPLNRGTQLRIIEPPHTTVKGAGLVK